MTWYPALPSRLLGTVSGLALFGAVPGLALFGATPDSHATQAPPAATARDDEATAKLQALLRLDTTNPPGREADAASLIAGWLAAEGIESQQYESAPGRLNVVARLQGSGDAPPLLLLNHLDVVMAEPAHWTHPPLPARSTTGPSGAAGRWT